MIVVADASPIIFLAKIRKLELLHMLLGKDIRVPRAVCRELLLLPGIDPVEKDEIKGFLADCTIEAVRRPRRFASAMSRADNAALTLAVRSKADVLLCDERVTRAMAEMEGGGGSHDGFWVTRARVCRAGSYFPGRPYLGGGVG